MSSSVNDWVSSTVVDASVEFFLLSIPFMDADNDDVFGASDLMELLTGVCCGAVLPENLAEKLVTDCFGFSSRFCLFGSTRIAMYSWPFFDTLNQPATYKSIE